VTRAGVTTHVVSWFELDCDDAARLTAAPRALGLPAAGAAFFAATHWPAAVQPLARRAVAPGEDAALAATHQGSRVAFRWAADAAEAPRDEVWQILKRRHAARVRETLHAAATPSPRARATADAIFALERDPAYVAEAPATYEAARALAAALAEKPTGARPNFPDGPLGETPNGTGCACF